MSEPGCARIGVVNESGRGETRVAATPPTVRQLIGLGYGVAIARGAGASAGFPDAAYTEAGAEIVDSVAAWEADIVFAVGPPTDAEIAQLRAGATLIALLAPGLDPARVEEDLEEAGSGGEVARSVGKALGPLIKRKRDEGPVVTLPDSGVNSTVRWWLQCLQSCCKYLLADAVTMTACDAGMVGPR